MKHVGASLAGAAAWSKKMIKIIRDHLKYKNLIISDDISMRSLKGSMAENTKKIFNAGCNIALHCKAFAINIIFRSFSKI